MNTNFYLLICSLMILSVPVDAQDQPTSVYDYNAAFGHGFYTKNGTATRSASGKPGHAYWQNSADYKINISLDEEKKHFTGSEVITYTNNSPDELNFLWVQVDQNLFKKDSRGNAVIPLSGSRNGAKGQDFDGGYTIGNVSLGYESNRFKGSSKNRKKNSKKRISKVDAEYEISDTRMKIYLPKPLAANGGKVHINIDFSFTSPDYGSDRMGFWKPKMDAFSILLNGTRECVSMMMFRVGTPYPILAQESFIWNMEHLMCISIHPQTTLLFVQESYSTLKRCTQILNANA